MSTIHSCWTPLGARSTVRCGTARYNTEKSIATRNVGTPSTASPTHSRRVAPVVDGDLSISPPNGSTVPISGDGSIVPRLTELEDRL